MNLDWEEMTMGFDNGRLNFATGAEALNDAAYHIISSYYQVSNEGFFPPGDLRPACGKKSVASFAQILGEIKDR